MTARSLWVDYAKAIGIILVVYGHVARGIFNAGLVDNVRLYDFLDSAIYAFHMPLFFFLSGLFFYESQKKRTLPSFFANKFDTLVYIYLVWSVLQSIIQFVFKQWTNATVEPSFLETILFMPVAQFWFLYALVFVFIFAVLVYRHISTKYFLVVFLIASLVTVSGLPNFGILQLTYIKHYFVYFAFGVYFKTIQHYLEQYKVTLFMPALILFLLMHYMAQVSPGHLNSVIGAHFIGLVLALVSIVFVAITSMILSDYPSKLLAYIGSSSLIIYLAHVITGSGVRIVLQYFAGVENYTVHIVAGCLFGIFGSILLYQVAMRLGLDWLFKMPRSLSVEKKIAN